VPIESYVVIGINISDAVINYLSAALGGSVEIFKWPKYFSLEK
jgi:hypothetical protein